MNKSTMIVLKSSTVTRPPPLPQRTAKGVLCLLISATVFVASHDVAVAAVDKIKDGDNDRRSRPGVGRGVVSLNPKGFFALTSPTNNMGNEEQDEL